MIIFQELFELQNAFRDILGNLETVSQYRKQKEIRGHNSMVECLPSLVQTLIFNI